MSRTNLETACVICRNLANVGLRNVGVRVRGLRPRVCILYKYMRTCKYLFNTIQLQITKQYVGLFTYHIFKNKVRKLGN